MHKQVEEKEKFKLTSDTLPILFRQYCSINSIFRMFICTLIPEQELRFGFFITSFVTFLM